MPLLSPLYFAAVVSIGLLLLGSTAVASDADTLQALATKYPALGWSQTGEPCNATSFPGVSCNSNLRVVQVRLSDITLPVDIITDLVSNFTFLRTLVLDNNGFVGAVPDSLFQSASLVTLDLNNQRFGSSIPDTIMQAQALRNLYIRNCDITGSLPASITELKQLGRLRLAGNTNLKIAGSILTAMPNLTMVDMSNTVVGLPWGKLPSVNKWHFLDLSHSVNISGPLPFGLSAATQLTELRLINVSLEGTIPDWLPNRLKNLRRVYLNTNMLEGTLPESLTTLTSLSHFYIAQNTLTGTVPMAFKSLPFLRNINLRNNAFSGCLPYMPLLEGCWIEGTNSVWNITGTNQTASAPQCSQVWCDESPGVIYASGITCNTGNCTVPECETAVNSVCAINDTQISSGLTFEVPTGGIAVEGNFTAGDHSQVVFVAPQNATLSQAIMTVSFCVNLNSSIFVDLSATQNVSQYESTGLALASYDPTCETAGYISSMETNFQVTCEGDHIYETQLDTSTPGLLSLMFVPTSSSKCAPAAAVNNGDVPNNNMTIIIGASVGAAVAFVAIVLLIVMLIPKARVKVFPFLARRDTASTVSH